MRINKYLASCELGSRRKCEDLVTLGKVAINGKVVRDLATQINPNDVVTVDGNSIMLNETPVYLIMNKPTKTITCCEDKRGRKTVLDVVYNNPKSINLPRVFPVGRLDYDTEGLLLLTNDGDFAESITHPKQKVEKSYIATLDKDFKSKDIEKLENGIILDGKMTLPATAKILSRTVTSLPSLWV